jgi:adenylate cyclase
MHVYSLEVGAPATTGPVPQERVRRSLLKPRISQRWRAAVAALAVALIAASAYGWHAGLATCLLGADVEDKLATAPRFSIVVLPFDNLSGDKEQDYFADGITDDLTTDLSHVDGSFVISRGTAFTYKGKAVDAKQIGRDLGVRYLLENSMRRVGETITVNAQLISTETGAQVWADRFDGDRSKLGELQVEFVSRLANSLGVELIRAEALRATRERPGNPDAVDLAMQGWATSFRGESKENYKEAIATFQRALALDPKNEPALRGLATVSAARVMSWWSEDPAGDIAHAEKAADAALALQPDDPFAHLAKAQVFYCKRQWEPAIAQAEAVVALDPNAAWVHAYAGFFKMFLGHSEDGLADVATALRLSPRDPGAPVLQSFMCELHDHLGQWEKAIPWCNKAIAADPELWWTFVDLAVVDAGAGRDKEAKEAVAQLQKVHPGFALQTWAAMSDDPTFKAQLQRYGEGLLKAGLPEEQTKTN